MSEVVESLNILAEKFASLEGVGRKTAMRMAYSIVEMDEEGATAFSNAILDVKKKVHLCPVCQDFTDRDVCSVCSNGERDASIICVVNDSKTIRAMEKIREFHGLYHVLHGLISPMQGINPENIKIRELLQRVGTGEVAEVIVATDPTVEGEATAMYISKLLKPLGVKVTRPATGIPVGADLEYADAITLSRAMEARREL